MYCKLWQKHRNIRQERRRGRGIRSNCEEMKQKIREHINSFRCRDSHYSRSESENRKYLPPELSFRKMWKLFVNDNPSCSRCKHTLYHSVFSKEYNLGFGNPKSDICGLCERLKAKIKASNDPKEKSDYITELCVHKKRAKYFYTLLNKYDVEQPSLTVSFDMQQNQLVPKLPLGEAFYARQIWVFNLTFVIHEKHNQGHDKVHVFTWDENQAGRDSNLVASALWNFLKNLTIPPNIKKIRFFTDACASQNRKTIIVSVLQHFVHHILLLNITFQSEGILFYHPIQIFWENGESFQKGDQPSTSQ